jgi:hypothetical protein
MWGATLGAICGYGVSALSRSLPELYFYPRSGIWSLATHPGEPAIQWYGFMIYSALGAILGLGAAALLPKRPPWFAVWGVAVLFFLVLVWHERSWFTR